MADAAQAAAPVKGSGDRVLENVQVDVTISVGHARPTMAELSKLDVDEVLLLDTCIDDPVELYIGTRLIAEGVLEELPGEGQNNVGVRVTRVLENTKAGV